MVASIAVMSEVLIALRLCLTGIVTSDHCLPTLRSLSLAAEVRHEPQDSENCHSVTTVTGVPNTRVCMTLHRCSSRTPKIAVQLLTPY